jgi:hypothetical protein
MNRVSFTNDPIVPWDAMCPACHGYVIGDSWKVVCGYCCGTGRNPVPDAEVVGGHRGRKIRGEQ